MLELALYIALIAVGIVGCAFKPKEFVSGLEPIKSSFITYSVFGMLISSDVFYPKVRIFLSLALLFVGLLGIKYMSISNSFEIKNAKDCLLYAAIIYVICKNFELPYKPLIDLITGLVALSVVTISLYLTYSFSKIKIMPIIERTEIFSIQFITIILTSIFCITNSPIPVIIALSISIYAIVLLFGIKVCLSFNTRF